MVLSEEKLKELQSECLADDIAIDVGRMSLWTEAEARTYFESGGETAPAAPVELEAPADDTALLAEKDRGSELLQASDFTGAVAAYRAALARCATPELIEKHAAALNSNLSMVLLKTGDKEGALAAAEACVKVKEDWPKAHYRKGEALFALQRYAAAAAAYDAALQLAPSDRDVANAKKLAIEAEKGGIWFRQLLPGKDIALRASTQIEQLTFGAAAQMQNFIYLIGDAQTRVCYAVDTAWDPAGIAAYAARHKMQLAGAIASHYHFDHIGGNLPSQMQGMVFGPFGVPKGVEPRLPGMREMKLHHGCALYCHASEVPAIAKQIGVEPSELTALKQDATIPLGAAGKIRVLHTPGHSSGSICLRLDPAEGGRPRGLVAGDTIFPGSCGRLDLPDSDVDAMFDSLEKLRNLDDAIPVYPGHAYSGASTTIAREKSSGLLRPFTRQMWKQMHG